MSYDHELPSASSTGWRVFAASVRGRDHEARQEPGQDRFAIVRRAEPGTGRTLLAIVAADGAGSARKSWAGAWAACRSIREGVEALPGRNARGITPYSAEFWTDDVIERLFETAYASVAQWSRALNATVDDLATTLNVAIVGDGFARFARVGDGILAYYEDRSQSEGTWTVAIEPDQGEYAGETAFLTSADRKERRTIVSLDRAPRHVIVATDGIVPIMIDQRQKSIFRPFVDPLSKALLRDSGGTDERSPGLQRFLASDRVGLTCPDDLTVILASRTCSAPAEVDETALGR